LGVPRHFLPLIPGHASHRAGPLRAGTRRARAASPTGKTFGAWDEHLSSVPAPTQAALRTLEWIGRHENLVVCGPSGTGKTFLLEALGQAAVETGKHVAWFTLEQLGVLIRRHRADDSVTRAISRILRADLVVVDLCRPRDYADMGGRLAGSARSAPHPRHSAGAAAAYVRSGPVRSGAAAGAVSPDPLCPCWPPRVRSPDRSREARSAERFALRSAFAAIGSFDDGVEEFPEFIPGWRLNSAFSASSASTRSAKTATIPARSSYEGEGWASAGTTTMIDDQGRKIKSDTPPRTRQARPAWKRPAQPPP
jgi:hypothetical protein